jgi:hypothetical protein
MKEKNKHRPDKTENTKKNAGSNQWFSTGLNDYPDNRERRDGPGGEDGTKKPKR